MNHLIDTLINGPTYYTQRHHLSPSLTLVVVLGALLFELSIVYLIGLLIVKTVQNARAILGLVLRRFSVGEHDVDRSFLELTFPADTSKSAFATEQQHILLRSIVGYRGLLDKLAARKKPYSMELAASQDDGIRYVLMIPTTEVAFVQRSLLSFLPGLKIHVVEDYMNGLKNVSVGVVELKLSADFVLPLQDHKTLTEHDLIAQLAGHMTKLADKELIAFQIVCAPVLGHTHGRVLRHARKLRHAIALGKEVYPVLAKQRSITGHLLHAIYYPPYWVLATTMKVIGGLFDIATSSSKSQPSKYPQITDKRRADDPYELELGTSIKAKLDQHLFEVSIRVLVAAPTPEVIGDRIAAVVSSFQTFAGTNQSIAVRKHVAFFASDDKLLPRFRQRSLSPHYLTQQTILSSAELSDLYHFPATDLTKTEGLVKSRSRELPTPLSIKRSDAELDVIVGVNQHGGDEQPIGMTIEQRQKHTYVIGKTGTGKTTLLTSAIYQDMQSGKGLAVLDPHGDMFQELLRIVPAHRRKDVIVFDPSDREWPVGLNLLDPGIEFADEDEKNDRITSSVLSVFAKLADESQWGPRMEHNLRNATMTALQLPNPSLYTLQRLLTDKKYQKEVATNLKDPVLKQFWQKEFALMGTMQLANASAPLTNRLGHFITSKMSRHILLQEKSSLRIADIMNEGKILLVNLSKGDIGEDQSRFFGTILTSFIWMAAYQRTKIPEKQRRDFFLYVDEFQNFATPLFSEIVSEGRKFHISLVLSHQNLAQIEDKNLVKLIAGNASTLICLKVGPEDEAFMLPYMKPEVVKGDMVNLAPYHFYIKTTSDVSEDAFSGQTVPLDVEQTQKAGDAVVKASRKQYGTPKAKVEAYMEELFTPTNPQTAVTVKSVSTSKPKDKTKLHGV